jgi:16S rRNA (guanine527-N7)-methyltransferase
VTADVPRETSRPKPTPVSRETSSAAPRVFGERLGLAQDYARLLATDGVVRGLIGPRESGRLWERHLLNSAVVGELIAPGAAVCDVGSGAGLPGIPLAIARPDLRIELVEPLLRRATFLKEVVAALGLASVTVTRSRAEELAGAGRADVVLARAVAPLPRLAGWCLPLLRPHGSLIALKGARARDELDAASDGLRRLGAQTWNVTSCGVEILQEPTTVVHVVMGPGPPPAASRRGGTKGAR